MRAQLKLWIVRALILDIVYRMLLRSWAREQIGMDTNPLDPAGAIALLESWWELPTYERGSHA